MFIIRDLPIILALFALLFGILGIIANQIPTLRNTIPKLFRHSLLYILTAGLLLVAILNRPPTVSNDQELTLLQEQLANASSISLWVQPKVATLGNQDVIPKAVISVKGTFRTIELSSDPEGANVFIADQLRGQTPLNVIVPNSESISYRVSAPQNSETGEAYIDFEGTLTTESTNKINVWLERTYE